MLSIIVCRAVRVMRAGGGEAGLVVPSSWGKRLDSRSLSVVASSAGADVAICRASGAGILWRRWMDLYPSRNSDNLAPAECRRILS